VGKPSFWTQNKRALSPIFATMLLAAIVITCGSIAYYFATNLATSTTNSYVSSLGTSQQSISERVGFENVVYTASSPATLKIFVINYGTANNLQFSAAILYDSNHTIVGQPYQGIFPVTPIDGVSPSPYPNNGLNSGNEGYFTITLSKPLSAGSTYTIQLITKSGSSFNYEFSV
jgi:hypothetical protein